MTDSAKQKREELVQEYMSAWSQDYRINTGHVGELAYRSGFDLGYSTRSKELEETLKVVREALEKIRDARLNNPNQEMGDLLLYKYEVSKEALALLDSLDKAGE